MSEYLFIRPYSAVIDLRIKILRGRGKGVKDPQGVSYATNFETMICCIPIVTIEMIWVGFN